MTTESHSHVLFRQYLLFNKKKTITANCLEDLGSVIVNLLGNFCRASQSMLGQSLVIVIPRILDCLGWRLVFLE